MKHLYKVPNTSKCVQKKYVRIGEGSITYSIGHHRFIEMEEQLVQYIRLMKELAVLFLLT